MFLQNLNLPQMPTRDDVNNENTQNVVVEAKENKSKESSEEEQLEDFMN